jgi:undecaprenyl-diphosphatase
MKTAAVFILLVAAGIAAVAVINRPLFGDADTAILQWVNNAAHCRALNRPMWLLSHIRTINLLLAAGVLVLLWRKRYAQCIVFVLLFFSLVHISIAMKQAAHLARPYESMPEIWVTEGGSRWVRLEEPRTARRMDSFPSGHAFTVFFFAGVFFRVRGVRWFFWAAAVLISFSRLYLGVHYISDVMFGAMAGFAVGAVVELLQFRSLVLEEAQ